MRRLSLLITLVPAFAAAQPAKPKPPFAKCERVSARQVSGAVEPGTNKPDLHKPGLHKLGDLPPAKPIYTVVREVDGCPTPVSVSLR
jgi:hypothetical protein